MDFHEELIQNWKDQFEGKIATRDDLYKEEVLSTLSYVRLRKIKRLIEDNQKDMQKKISHEEWVVLYSTHKHLKDIEIELMSHVGSVIIK